ncbi:hypothetical protein FOZ62_013589 [Perkinsus olseni]|uniref:Uncharacterized protein n=2 Tax=Perkinsus olseni TaxID=32597 RepID=A0A7J6QJM3_PEROL|nr:hypothetical protein FOZ62_013589 [Perkinsus olseni]
MSLPTKHNIDDFVTRLARASIILGIPEDLLVSEAMLHAFSVIRPQFRETFQRYGWSAGHLSSRKQHIYQETLDLALGQILILARSGAVITLQIVKMRQTTSNAVIIGTFAGCTSESVTRIVPLRCSTITGPATCTEEAVKFITDDCLQQFKKNNVPIVGLLSVPDLTMKPICQQLTDALEEPVLRVECMFTHIEAFATKALSTSPYTQWTSICNKLFSLGSSDETLANALEDCGVSTGVFDIADAAPTASIRALGSLLEHWGEIARELIDQGFKNSSSTTLVEETRSLVSSKLACTANRLEVEKLYQLIAPVLGLINTLRAENSSAFKFLVEAKTALEPILATDLLQEQERMSLKRSYNRLVQGMDWVVIFDPRGWSSEDGWKTPFLAQALSLIETGRFPDRERCVQCCFDFANRAGSHMVFPPSTLKLVEPSVYWRTFKGECEMAKRLYEAAVTLCSTYTVQHEVLRPAAKRTSRFGAGPEQIFMTACVSWAELLQSEAPTSRLDVRPSSANDSPSGSECGSCNKFDLSFGSIGGSAAQSPVQYLEEHAVQLCEQPVVSSASSSGSQEAGSSVQRTSLAKHISHAFLRFYGEDGVSFKCPDEHYGRIMQCPRKKDHYIIYYDSSNQRLDGSFDVRSVKSRYLKGEFDLPSLKCYIEVISKLGKTAN